MVPPTGVSDSILLVRHYEASLEQCYGAFAPHNKLFEAKRGGYQRITLSTVTITVQHLRDQASRLIHMGRGMQQQTGEVKEGIQERPPERPLQRTPEPPEPPPETRRRASRLDCVIHAIKSGQKATSRVKKLMRDVRGSHHTLNLRVLTLLKTNAVDRVRILARRKLLQRLRWVEDNNNFSSNSSKATSPSTRGIYERSDPLQDTRALEDFVVHCAEHLSLPKECPPVSAAEVMEAVREKCNFSAPGPGDQSMDSNDDRLRKLLGDKWKGCKTEKSSVESQMIEASNFSVHPDYLTKYGTLSNGVLTKSIKCAETWLYGTVGVRGASNQRPSLFLYPGVPAPTPRFLNQSSYLTSPGPYLGISSYPLSERNGYVVSQPRKFTVKPNDLQLHQCRHCGKDIRTGTSSLCKKCIEKRNGTCKRSRCSLKETKDRRTLALPTPDPYSLMRNNRLGVSEVTEPSGFSLGLSNRKKRNASASPLRRRIQTSPSFETFKPKEAKPWKSADSEWTNGGEEVVRRKSILECDLNAYELNKSKIRDAGDSSDESGESHSKGSPKLRLLRPKLNKINFSPNKSEASKTTEEVRLNGQRFRIFDHSNPSMPVIEGYVSDGEECKMAKESLIPRLPSPKRPPRRPKDKILKEGSFKYSKPKSKSSPNLSIKSILKKPIDGDDSSLSELIVMQCELPTDDVESKKPTQQSLLNKKQNQSTLKKKKQVQFRVNISSESLAKPKENETVAGSKGTEVFEGPVHRSVSCHDLSSTSSVINECETKDEALQGSEEELLSEASHLKRSYSDRRPSSALVLYKDGLSSLSDSHTNLNLFNDTMALRTRPKRSDIRTVFQSETKSSSEKLDRKNLSPTTEFKFAGNFITYEEFSKLTDSSSFENEVKIKKSKLPVSSCMTFKKKSPAPNPPPRQAPSKSTKTTNGAIPFQICIEKELKDSNSSVAHPISESTSNQDMNIAFSPEAEIGKTSVKLSTFHQEAESDSAVVEGKRTSVKIHPKNLMQEPDSIIHPRRRASVMISAFDPQDSNKVTISVRNDEEPSASTCTIIETGSNSTVIPVMSTDNKTTLIVGSTSAASQSVENTHSSSSAQEHPKPYIFSTVNSEVDFMDPVEAIRRNLIPHICGKEDYSLTLMERIKQTRESKEQKNLKLISQLFEPTGESPVIGQPPQFLISSYKSKKPSWKVKSEEDSSTTTSRSNSFCSTLNGSIKNSSGDTSRSSSFRSSCYKSLDSDCDTSLNKFYQFSDTEDTSGQERDKLEYEYEIRNGFKDGRREDGENIYETIKEEPIYDQIAVKITSEESEEDVPPPLPLTLPPSLEEIDKKSTKSIFEGASKYEILNYLVDAKERVQEECYFSGSSTSEDADGKREKIGAPVDTSRTRDAIGQIRDDRAVPERDCSYDMSSRISNLSQASYSSDDNITSRSAEREALKLTRKSSAEIERNDSGVGSETSHTSRNKWRAAASIREDPQHLCEDCDQVVETQVTDSGVMYAPLVCRKCSKRRAERKEIIQEIVETEEKYGRDLKIILEEFYTPMLVAGLLTSDQLSAIFLNTEELLENSEQLTEKLRDTLEIAQEQGDEDLLTVNMGKLFLEAGPMLHAFESYCTRQGGAAILLANLEKEKELLRIFLRVSQMENTVLRRMNLNSFLMVPVQRVTKYPLLLARLYKVTPPQQEGRELLKEAQHNIELHLEHMNSEAKDVSATKVWRRFSTSAGTGRKSTSELEMINIKLRKMAVDILDWNHEEVRFVMEGKLLYTQPTDNNWKRGRTIKLTPVFVLLVTLGKPNSKYKMDPSDDQLTFPSKTGVREATLLLVKEKCGRYTLIREPLYLDKIIVCCEADVDEFFEVQELSTKDSFIFKAEDGERTKEWYKYLQYHAQILGSWRRRRNALANIMINGMMARTYTS